MSQETGKTNQEIEKKLSIQISLNGQYFLYKPFNGVRTSRGYAVEYLCSYIVQNGITNIDLYLAQNSHITIPEELFVEENIDSYLSAKNICASGIVVNNVISEIVVLYPLFENLLADIDILGKFCKVNILHTLAWLISMAKEQDGSIVLFSYIDKYIYLVIKHEGDIQLIECLELQNEDDIPSLIELLISRYFLKDCKLFWLGSLSDSSSNLFHNTYSTYKQ